MTYEPARIKAVRHHTSAKYLAPLVNIAYLEVSRLYKKIKLYVLRKAVCEILLTGFGQITPGSCSRGLNAKEMYPFYEIHHKGWFSYVGKIPDGRGFYFLPTVPDFADISDSRRKSVQILPISPCLCVIGGLEFSNRGLVMSEVHPRSSPTVQN